MTSSFIICTKDRDIDLRSCLESIVVQTILPAEVIVVDASSDDICLRNEKNGRDILCEKTRFIYTRSKPSTTRQRNIGIDRSLGDVIFFLDDDVILNADYHEKILEVYQQRDDGNLGGVRGSYVNYYRPNTLENIFRKIFFMNVLQLKGRSWISPSLNPVEVLVPDRIMAVEYMPSCICSYYRKVLDEFRFDEHLDRYGLSEDLDLSYRISRKYKLYQTPYARLIHNHSSIARINMREFRRLQIMNLHYLVMKHFGRKSFHMIAFYWNVLGHILFELMRYVRTSDNTELRGIVDGFIYTLGRKSMRV